MRNSEFAILIGGSHLITPEVFLEDVKELGNAGDDEE